MKIRLVLLFLMLTSFEGHAQETGKIDLDYCHIPGLNQEVLCGTYTVEENRQQPNGRTIDLQISILPAVSETKEPDPLVLFAGGPGQGARSMGRFVKMAFSEVNETRDIVLIDQRGMGDSRPLECDFPEMDLTEMDSDKMQEISIEALKKCAATIDADVTQYTQDIANQDIHEALEALGYDQVNLYGASWGTRSILLYANQFPEKIRTVTVDGVAPLSNRVPLYFTRDAEKALNLLLQDCSVDEQCNNAFEDIEQRFRQFMNDFPEEGIPTRLADPNTGKMVDVTINKEAVISSIRTILYSPDLSRMLPVVMERLMENDFRPLAGIMSAMGDMGMTIGATLTILCSEEFARISDAEIKEQASVGFEAATFATQMADSCELWPRAPLPGIYNQELVQNMPTLILNGTLDPVTPPYWGDDMAVHFPNSRHLIAPNTGHNVAPVGCADDLIAQFIKEASYENIDDACLQEIKRPSFFLNASGPVARTEQ
jgi:pimeloyl-ACP methyl ester carboxylesterase